MPSQLKDPQAAIDQIIAAANKKYGPGTLHKASESVPVNRVPFVEPQLNYATQGGAPFGRFIAMAGAPNSGKSRVSLELIAQAQQLPYSAEIYLIPRIAHHSALVDDASLHDDLRRKHQATAENLMRELDWIRLEFPNGADAVLYNTETAFDPLWAESLGVDLTRLMIHETTTIEEITEIMQGLYQHIPIHVIDSTTNASSIMMQAADMGKPSYGRDALQWKNCLRTSMTTWDRDRNIGIMIHQMSTNQKTGGQQANATRYMHFISRLSLRFDHGKFLWLKDGVLLDGKPTGADDQSMAGQAEADGREVFVKCEKSTVGRPGRVAGLQWSYGEQQFRTVHEMAAAGIYYRVIEKSGSWYKVLGEDKTLGQGMKSVYRRIEEDGELRAQIVCRLLDFVSQK